MCVILWTWCVPNKSNQKKNSFSVSIVGIGNIAYKPDAGPEDTMVFKHYNAKEVWWNKMHSFPMGKVVY